MKLDYQLILFVITASSMSKKRGVVVSIANHHKTVSKSKSAHTNPLVHQVNGHNLNDNYPEIGSRSGAINPLNQVQLSESNLLGEDAPRLVNQAYYTYQDPDSHPQHESDRFEDNDQYVIESMQKRKQIIQSKKRLQEKMKIIEKAKIMEARSLKNNQVKEVKNRIINKQQMKKVTVGTPKISKKQKNNKASIPKIFPQQQIIKKNIYFEILKPKPLIFDVNMLDKGTSSPKKCVNLNETEYYQNNIQRGVKIQRNEQQLGQQSENISENINCKRLPFRFQGIL